MNENTATTGLPPGWKMNTPRTDPDKPCIALKHLEDFKYAEIHYEPVDGVLNDYALYRVDCEGPGPYQSELQGRFEDLNKAIRAGERL